MEEIRRRMYNIGSQFFPLTSLNAAALFFRAVAAFPASVPNREPDYGQVARDHGR